MRVEEKCPCGGELAVVYEAHTSYSGPSTREVTEARKQIDTFRRAHKPCLKRLAEPAMADVTSLLGGKPGGPDVD